MASTPNPTESAPAANTDSGIDAASWLNQQRKTKLNSIQDINTFVTTIYNLPAQSLPNPEKLLEIIDAQHVQVYPQAIDSRTNPQSEPYSTVSKTIDSLLNTEPLKVLYSTPINDLNHDTKKIAVVLPDVHTDPQERLDYYNFLAKIFASNHIQLSSGFTEGEVNPNEVLPTIAKGFTNETIKDLVFRNRLGPEQGLLYFIQEHGKNTGSQSFAAFAPEQITTSENVRILMKDIIAIACGAYPTLFPKTYNEQGTHYLTLLHNTYSDFNCKNLGHEFLVMFTTIIKQQLNQLKLSDQQKRQIVSQAIAIFLNPTMTQQDYLLIPRVINAKEYEDLCDFYRQERFEHGIKQRNINIAEAYDKEKPGTRLMIIGSSHIDIRFSKEYSLIKLLEQKQIPVIVVTNPNSKNKVVLN